MSLSSKNIADIRTDYQLSALDEQITCDNPLLFFHKWFTEAETYKIHEVNAMTLATVDEHGKPHARIVLLKGLDEKGFVFFTNYNSAKGKQIEKNSNAAIVFFWRELERQIRIEGTLEKIAEEESEAYFNSRPENSRIGAWSSPQSEVIPDRSVLDSNYKEFESKFSGQIPRPSHWGGYRLVPDTIEFWQGRCSRMHDRILFTSTGSGWRKCRLAP